MSLPELEKDLPSAIRFEMGPMAMLSVEELEQLSRESLDQDRQERLELLAERQKKQPLSDTEHAELFELVEQAQRVMLRRAEARRLLVLRGFRFPPGLPTTERCDASAPCCTPPHRGTRPDK